MSSPEADVEVLVHITAPTTAGHDNVYRLQAEESLGFVPVSRVEVGRVIWPRTRTLMVEEDELGRLKELTADGSKREAEAEGQEEERPAKRARRVPIPTPTPSSRLRSSSRRSQASVTSSPTVPFSHHEPSSQVSPLHPTQTRTLRKSSQLQQEILVPQTIERPPWRPQNAQEEEEYTDLAQAFDSFCSDLSVPDSQSQVQPSVVPTTPWLQASVGLLSSPREDPEQSQQTTAESRSNNNTPSQQVRRSQRLRGRHQRSAPETPGAANSLVQVPFTPQLAPISYTSAFGRQSAGPVLTFATPAPNASSLVIPAPFSPVPASEISDIRSTPVAPPPFDCVCPLPTLVEPPYIVVTPSPETSSSPPQVSDGLYQLVKTKMSGKFHSRISSITRPLSRWERGHWLVDMAGWGDPLHKARFWRAMKDGVLKGRMGCVTMVLETEEYADTTEMWVQGREWEAPGRREMERRGNTVKVYCWGATAEFVWCALYIFGYRGVDGVVWVDAAGQVVVRMA